MNYVSKKNRELKEENLLKFSMVQDNFEPVPSSYWYFSQKTNLNHGASNVLQEFDHTQVEGYAVFDVFCSVKQCILDHSINVLKLAWVQIL